MKRIRLDSYDYRVRKGRAYILLSPVEGTTGTYRIPSSFARKEDRIDIGSCHLVADNGDLLLYHVQLREAHTGPVRDREWVPLDRIRELQFDAGNPAELRFRIFDLFLDIFRAEKDARLYQAIAGLREAAWPDVLRENYANELQNALDGRWSYPNLTPPDPERVREELRTLAHFRRHLPKEDNPMRQFDVMDWYEPIDWIALGSRQQ